MKKLLFYIVAFSFLMAGCKSNSPKADGVRIANKTTKNIVCVLGYNYPDLSFSFTSKQAILAKSELLAIDAGETKAIDTLGLCNQAVWNNTIQKSMLMLFVFDKDKLASTDKLEDALLERYYFSYIQLMKTKGYITIK